MRRAFLREFGLGLVVVWPVVSGLLALICILGLLVGLLEHWSVLESLYFAFVSGLTIGYGDFAPRTAVARALAVAIGLSGVLLAALIAAVAVKALSSVPSPDD
jgi:hypothetical protein